MASRDLVILQQVEDQILGVSGPDLLLPESTETAVLRAIHSAVTNRDADATRLAFGLIWDDPVARRQPWAIGIRSHIGSRLYGSVDRMATVSLASDLIANPQVAHAVGRDEFGIWIPEQVFRLIADDLELDAQLDGSLEPSEPPVHILMHWLRTITAGEPTPVAIFSPAYWSLVPGWYLVDRGSPEMTLLTDAYRRRTVTTSTMLADTPECPLGGISSFVPARSHWAGFASLIATADLFDRTADIDAISHLVQAIPSFHRNVLLSSDRGQSLPQAMNGFLSSVIGRYLLCGVYVPIGGSQYSYLQRPGMPYEPAAISSLADGRIAISASIIPSSLTFLGLLPEAPRGIGGLPYISYPWSTLCGPMGMGTLLAQAWPARTTVTGDHLPYADEWLILPNHLADLLSEALQRAEDLHREPEHFT